METRDVIVTVNRSRQPTLAVVLLLVVAACGPSAGSSAAATIETAAASTAPTATVTISSAAVPLASDVPSASVANVTPTSEIVSFEPIPAPPAALMSVEGGDAVPGDVGGYTWQQSGQSAPWLPGEPIHVGSLEALRVVLAEPVGIDHWTASRVRSDNLDGGAIPIGEGSGDRIVFPAPPPGRWSVHVGIWFADNQGSAAYFWAVDVD